MSAGLRISRTHRLWLPCCIMILTVTPNPCVDKTLYLSQSYAPGARVRVPRYDCIAGGKGSNVSRALARLGYPTQAMCVLGGATGQHTLELLRSDGVEVIPCWVSGMTRTITTIYEESVGRQTAFYEPGSPVSEEEQEAIVETFRHAVQKARLVTLNGTVPDPCLDRLYAELIPIAKASGVSVLLDAHGRAFCEGLAAGPYLVKPNLEEAAEAVGHALESEAAQWEAIDRFHACGVALAVISRGKAGALISFAGERLRVLPPEVHEVNPVGSGDVFLAGFAIGLLEGWDLERMARFGTALGAANAATWEIGRFDIEQVRDLEAAVHIERC